MAVAAYLRITKRHATKDERNVVWWKTGLGNWESSPLLSNIVELFPGSRADQSRVFVCSTQSQESWGQCLGTVYQLARLMINGLEASEE